MKKANSGLRLGKKVVTAALAVLFFTAFTTAVASAATYTVCAAPACDYASIQLAVDLVPEGNTVYVYNGTYSGNVYVYRRLTLEGEGADVVDVTAPSSNDDVFDVAADYVNISGFNVTGATGNQKAGIYLNGSEHCNISENNVSNNYYGIRLESSSNNTLTSNTANENTESGIRLFDSSDNTFTSNIASNNKYGIYLTNGMSSNNNTFTNDTASSNTDYDFYSDAASYNNTVTNLTISSYPTSISFTYDKGIGIKGVTTPPEPDPAGKMNISKYVNVTNVTADSWLFLNVSYTDADVSGVEEDSLRLYRWNGTAWTDISGSNVNTAENYVYANVTSFSQIAPFGNPTPPVPVPVFNTMGSLALVGILSVMLAIATLRKKK